jgi:5-methylcytosine-specific restriction endonuclease McrA
MKGSPVRVRASAQRKGPARGPFLSGVKELTPWSLVADPCQDDAAMIAAACSSSRQGAACRGSVAGMSYRSPAQKARTRRTKAERRRRQALIAQHVALYGWVCPGYGRPWHESRDLTADHLVPVARGDSEQGTIRVLCRSCNSRRGAGGVPLDRDERPGQPDPALRERNSSRDPVRKIPRPRFSRSTLSGLETSANDDPQVG